LIRQTLHKKRSTATISKATSLIFRPLQPRPLFQESVRTKVQRIHLKNCQRVEKKHVSNCLKSTKEPMQQPCFLIKKYPLYFLQLSGSKFPLVIST
jgi:hypothetical protein